MLHALIGRLTGRSRPSEADRMIDAAGAARAAGDLDGAARLLARVVAEQPQRVSPRCLLADVHLERGDHRAAEAVLRAAIDMAPADSQAHELLGYALRRRGAAEEASRELYRAIQLDWHSQSARIELAAALIELGRPHEAVPLLRWVLKRDPDLAGAHLNCGIALQEMGQFNDALPHFERAAALEPQRIDHLNHVAMCLRGLDRHDEAVRELERALVLAPGDPATVTNLGAILRELGRPEEAREALATLVAHAPDFVGGRCALAAALQDLGDVAGAREQYDAAVAMAPASGGARLGRALLHLALGDFARGWEDYEGRFESSETPRRGFPYPDWDGGPFTGRSVLVYAEQGLGDEIMFASVLPDLIREATRVVVECDPRLAPLLRRSFPAANVYGAPRTWAHDWLAGAGAIDVQVAAGSLPHRYRRALTDFPAHRGYLVPDNGRVEHYRERLAALGSTRKIGIAWRGGLARTRQAVRSVPLARLAPLLARRELQFVSLQHGATDADLAQLQEFAGNGVAHWAETIADPDETAALMSALDDVVTVCSSVVHLGGALGARVLAMVPATPEWRYLMAGDRMPWYPSVELVRQARVGEWGPVVGEVANRL